MTTALPPVVDADTWQRQLDALRAREKAATRELGEQWQCPGCTGYTSQFTR